jgi:hypothetical protein
MEQVSVKRINHGLLLRAPEKSLSGLYEACVIRTPVIRFEIRHILSRSTPYFHIKWNWPSDKGEVVPFPLKYDESLKAHLVRLLETAWTYDVLPELKKRRITQTVPSAVQVLYSSGQQPVVRLDEQVRIWVALAERHEDSLSEPGLLLRLNPGFVRPNPTKGVIDMELFDDEQTCCGHFTSLRAGGCWWGMINFVGLLPQSVQHIIQAWENSPISRSIILTGYGNDSAKCQLLHQLNVDAGDLPHPLKKEVPNLLYASVSRAYNNTPVQQMQSQIERHMAGELLKEKEAFDWDRFADYPDRLAVSPESAREMKQGTEIWLRAAALSRREQAIVQLDVMLECQDRKWTQQQKANHLRMGLKNYEKHRRHARMALQEARKKPVLYGYERLLDKILKGLDKK